MDKYLVITIDKYNNVHESVFNNFDLAKYVYGEFKSNEIYTKCKLEVIKSITLLEYEKEGLLSPEELYGYFNKPEDKGNFILNLVEEKNNKTDAILKKEPKIYIVKEVN